MTGNERAPSELMCAPLFAATCASFFVLVSCARKEAPAPESQAPVASAARAELPTSLREDISTMSAARATAALADASRAFDDSLALATPDCPTARTLRDRICELSARICTLSQTEPTPELASACTDGRTRCNKAKERVGASCQ